MPKHRPGSDRDRSRSPPALRVMATPIYWLTCCCWASRIQCLRLHAPSPKEGPAVRPHRSARSVFGTRHPDSAPPSSRKIRPSRPLRQLVKVPPRATRQPRHGCCGTAASPVPSGRPFHDRGSLLTGARKAYLGSRHPVKGPAQGRCGLLFPRKRCAKYLTPVSRGDAPCPIQQRLGTQSVYYDTTTMSSGMPSVTTSNRLAGGDGSVSQGTQQGYYARNTMSSGSHRIRGDAALVTGFFAEVTRHQ